MPPPCTDMAGMRNARETTWARAQAMDGALSGGRVGVEEVAGAVPESPREWRTVLVDEGAPPGSARGPRNNPEYQHAPLWVRRYVRPGDRVLCARTPVAFKDAIGRLCFVEERGETLGGMGVWWVTRHPTRGDGLVWITRPTLERWAESLGYGPAELRLYLVEAVCLMFDTVAPLHEEPTGA